MRDYQRQKVYDAENAVLFDLPSERDPERLIAELSGHFHIDPPNVVHNPRLQAYAGQYTPVWRGSTPVITFKRAAPIRKVVLHEFAHHLADMANPGNIQHQAQFAAALLDVHALDGTDALLKGSFDDHGVLYTIEAQQERTERLNDRRVAARTTNLGEVGLGWVLAGDGIRYSMPNGSQQTSYVYVRLIDRWGPRQVTQNLRRAKVWRNEASAAKHLTTDSLRERYAVQRVKVVRRQRGWEAYDEVLQATSL